MSINELDMKVKELRELRRMAEELQAEIDAAQDVTSSRLDTAALKKALPDLAQQFTKTSTNRRFCVD